jgi:cellulose biosynthesis protein BcsQ
MNFADKAEAIGQRMSEESVSLKDSLLANKAVELLDEDIPEGMSRLFYNHALNKSEVHATLFEDIWTKKTFNKKLDKAVEDGHVDEPIRYNKKHLYTRHHIAQIMEHFEFEKYSDNHKPFVINVANYKGGVGKSTTSVTLAVKMALDLELNARVCLLDLDPQGSAARGIIQVDEDEEQYYLTVADLQCYDLESRDEDEPNEVKDLLDSGISFEELVLASPFNTHLPNLDVITAFPSDEKFNDYFIESDDEKQLDLVSRLREKIIPILKQKYDIILLDLPPQNSPIVWSAFEACDGVLTPVAPKAYDYASTESFLPTIAEVTRRLPSKSENIQYFRVLTVNYDEREKHERKLHNKLMRSVREDLLPKHISHSPLFLEAAAQNCTIYDIMKSKSKCTSRQYDEAITSSNDVYKNVMMDIKLIAAS